MKIILTNILFVIISFVAYSQTYKVTEIDYVGKVSKIENLNTSGLEFSPVWHNNQLIYVSSREYDLLTLGENNWTSSGYLNIYKAKLKNKTLSDSATFKQSKLFSNQIIGAKHSGPICFSVTGDTIFFSQTTLKSRKNRKKVLYPQLYMATKKGNSWTNIHALSFNNLNYSYSHPTYNSKTKTLYFVSNMKGGKGGKDIYTSTLTNGNWSTPKNLAHVNSSADDLFPHISGDDIFIASNKPGGKGGLDVYWCNLNPQATLKNLKTVNTKHDDFGLFILPDLNNGFISSNRNGNDDVFYMNIKKVITVTNELAGKFKFKNLDGNVSDLKIMLIDEDGNITFETVTSKNGEFKFNNLDLNEGYTIKTMSEEDLDLFIYDQDGNQISRLQSDAKGLFTYKKLNYSNVGTMSLIPEDQKDYTADFGHLSGQFIYEELPGKYPNNLKVMLVDERDIVKFKTNTDERGNFDFKNLSLKENYILKLEDQTQNLTLYIYDKKGNVVAQLKSNKLGQFTYRKLDGDFAKGLKYLSEDTEDKFELDTKTISGNFNYKTLEGNFKNGLTVYIYNEEGILIATEKTNEKGEFRFRNLPLNDNFLFKIEEDGMPLDMNEFALFLEDRYGKKVAQLQRGENGYFIYKPLGLSTNNNLTLIKEDTLAIDYVPPALNNEHLVKKVYFNSNRAETKNSDLKILNAISTKMKANPNLKLEINAYADSRSSDEYNLILSGKRGQWIVDYLVNKGIPKSKMIVNAYGEGQLAVKCVNCTDADHAKNRRAELRVY